MSDSAASPFNAQGSEDGSENLSALPSAEDISKLVDDLQSQEQEAFDKSFETLNDLLDSHQEFAAEHLPQHIVSLLPLIKETQDGRRSAIASLLTKLIALNYECSAAFKPHISELGDLLVLGSEVTRHNLAQAFEYMLSDEEDDVEAEILKSLKGIISSSLPPPSANSSSEMYDQYACAGELMQAILMYDHTRTRTLAFKAGAPEFLAAASKVPNIQSRIMAISCFQQIYNASDEICSDSTSIELSSSELKVHTLNLIIERLGDSDLTVATSVLDFIEVLDLPDDFTLQAHPTFGLDLMRYLSRWDPEGDVPFPYIFDKILSEEEDPDNPNNVVSTSFRRIFRDSQVDSTIALGALSRLPHVHSSVRDAAIKEGAVDFVVRMLGPNESTETKTYIMSSIVSVLEQDQTFGSHLSSAGIFPLLVAILGDNTNLPSEPRALAVSALAKLTDSCSADDYQPIRKDVVRALITPDVLSTILRIASQSSEEDPELVKAVFELLSTMAFDNGEYDNDDDTNNTFEAPDESQLSIAYIKNLIISPTLLTNIFDNLADHQIGPSASDLLAQLCYERPDTLAEVIELARTKYMPTAPSSLFAAFLPGDSEGSAPPDAVTKLIRGLVDAGAFKRMSEILRLETDKLQSNAHTTDKHPGAAMDDRRVAVRAMRALLSGDDVNKDVARQDTEHLPKLVVSLLLDGTYKSLLEVQKILDQLVEYDVENAFEAWAKDLGTEDVAQALVKALAIREPRDVTEADMEKDELLAAQVTDVAAWNEFEGTITAACEIITNILPILDAHRSTLASALLKAYFYTRRNANAIFSAFNSFVITPTDSTSYTNPFSPKYTPLMSAVRDLLASDSPPTPAWIPYVITINTPLCFAFSLGGILPHIVQLVDSYVQENNDGDDEFDVDLQELQNTAIDIFEVIILRLRDPDTRADLSPEDLTKIDKDLLLPAQRTFFHCPRLVAALHNNIVQHKLMRLGEEWDKFQALTATHHLNNISAGYPKALEAFVALEPSIHEPLLRLLDDEKIDHETSAPDAGKREAPLLGALVVCLYAPQSANVQGIETKRKEVKDGVTSVFEGMIAGLKEPTPPTTDQPSDPTTAVGKGGKKGRKKKQKKWAPRFSVSGILKRMHAFLSVGLPVAGTAEDDTPGASTYPGRDALVDVAATSGVLNLAFDTFNAGVGLSLSQNATEDEATAPSIGQVELGSWMFALRNLRDLFELSVGSSNGLALVLKARLEKVLEGLKEGDESELNVDVGDEEREELERFVELVNGVSS